MLTLEFEDFTVAVEQLENTTTTQHRSLQQTQKYLHLQYNTSFIIKSINHYIHYNSTPKQLHTIRLLDISKTKT